MSPAWWSVESGPGERIGSPEDAVARLGWLRPLQQEACGMLVTDGQGRLVASGVLSLGTFDHTFMAPFEVVRQVLSTPSGAGAWLAHNHPSGDPRPSPDDRAVWGRLQAAGRVAGVHLWDALVVGGDEAWWSIARDRGHAPVDERAFVGSPEAAMAARRGGPVERGTVEVLACDQRHRVLDVTTHRLDEPGWSRGLETRVLRSALAAAAPALVVVAHVDNHRQPDGELVTAANRLEAGAATLGIRVLDVIAHGPAGHTSLARRNLLGSSLSVSLPRQASTVPPQPLPPPTSAARPVPTAPPRAVGR